MRRHSRGVLLGLLLAQFLVLRAEAQNFNVIGDFSTGEQPRSMAVSGSYLYLARSTGDFVVVDVSDPANMSLVAEVSTLDPALSLAVHGTKLYVAEGSVPHDDEDRAANEDGIIEIFDISDPAAPVSEGQRVDASADNNTAVRVVVRNSTLYTLYSSASNQPRNVEILDLNPPGTEKSISSLQKRVTGLDVSGSMLFATDTTLKTYDTSGAGDAVLLKTFDTPGTASDVIVSGNVAYVADGEKGLTILNIANPAAPVLLSNRDTVGVARRLALDGTRLYVSDYWFGFNAYDVSDPQNPLFIGFMQRGGIQDIAVSGSVIFISQDYYVVEAVEFTGDGSPVPSPTPIPPGCEAPPPIGQFGVELATKIGGSIEMVAQNGNMVYAGEGSQLSVFDVSDPFAPQKIRASVLPDTVLAIGIQDPFAYVTADNGDLNVYSLADPTSPTLIRSVYAGDWVYDIAFSESMMFMQGASATSIWDISNPVVPERLGGTPDWETGGVGVAASGKWAFVAGFDDLFVYDISNPAFPQLVNRIDILSEPGDIAIVGSNVFLAEGESGFRVSDFTNPLYSKAKGWYDPGLTVLGVRIEDTLAYLSMADAGFQIVDIGDLPTIQVIGSVDTPGTAFQSVGAGNHAYVADRTGLQVINTSIIETPAFNGRYRAMVQPDVVSVQDHFLYAFDSNIGLHVLDISDPVRPANLGFLPLFADPSDVVTGGNLACVVTKTLYFIDISDPNQPSLLGVYTMPSHPPGVFLSGTRAYVTQHIGNLTVLDISDPSNPSVETVYPMPGSPSGIAIRDSLAYVSQHNAGMSVVDLSDPTSPTTLGSYSSLDSEFGDIQVWGDTDVLNGIFGVEFIDISNPQAPQQIRRIDHTADWGFAEMDGALAYVESTEGFSIYDLSESHNPIERAFYFLENVRSGIAVSRPYSYAPAIREIRVVRYTGPIPQESTPTPSPTPTRTPTPSISPSPTGSFTPTPTPSPSPTQTATATRSASPTSSPINTGTPTPTPTPTPTLTSTPSPTPAGTLSSRIQNFLLEIDQDSTGLDLNGDGQVDIADLLISLSLEL